MERLALPELLGHRVLLEQQVLKGFRVFKEFKEMLELLALKVRLVPREQPVPRVQRVR